MACHAFGIKSVEVIRSQILVSELRMGKHHMEHRQQAMGDRHCGPVLASPRCNASILRLEVAVLLPARCPRSLNQCPPQPAIATLGLGALKFARRRFVPRTDPTPGTKMSWGGKASHVRADF